MRHERALRLLDDYVDGELSATESAELESHLAGCRVCRDEVELLRGLLQAADRLPRSIEPPRDLWPDVEPRLDAGRVRTRRPLWKRHPLAVAASVLIVVSAASLMLVRGPASKGAKPGPEGAASSLARWGQVEAGYRQAAEELRATLELVGSDLPPATRARIEENLEIIDGAIAESRAALEEHPDDRELQELLASTYQRKLSVLQQATRLASDT